MSTGGDGTISNSHELDRPIACEIRVSGRLDSQWWGWFDKLTITQAGDQTLLRGTLTDQAALYGILLKLHNLGLPLLSVNVTGIAYSKLPKPYGNVATMMMRIVLTAGLLWLIWCLGGLEASGVTQLGRRQVWRLALVGMLYLAGASLYAFYGKPAFDVSSAIRTSDARAVILTQAASVLYEEILFRGVVSMFCFARRILRFYPCPHRERIPGLQCRYRAGRNPPVLQPSPLGQGLIRATMRQMHLSPWVYHRVLKVSRTIADLEGPEGIQTHHLAEALPYRSRALAM